MIRSPVQRTCRLHSRFADGRSRAAAGKDHLRHRLARAGRARRLLPGAWPKALYRKHGLDVTLRSGGPQVNGLQLLAAGQLDVVMADALQVLSAIEQNVPVVDDRRDVPEESHGDHRASGRAKRSPISRASRSRSAPRRTRRSGRGSSRSYGFTDDQKRPYAFCVQPFLADRNLSQQGFATSEPFSIEKGGVKPVVFLLADLGYPPYSEALVVTRDTLAKRGDALRRFVQRVRRRLEELSRQPCAGQCAHQEGESRDERRAPRLRPREDEGVRDRRPAATREAAACSR